MARFRLFLDQRDFFPIAGGFSRFAFEFSPFFTRHGTDLFCIGSDFSWTSGDCDRLGGDFFWIFPDFFRLDGDFSESAENLGSTPTFPGWLQLFLARQRNFSGWSLAGDFPWLHSDFFRLGCDVSWLAPTFPGSPTTFSGTATSFSAI